MRKSFTYCLVGILAATMAGSVTYALEGSSLTGSTKKAGETSSSSSQSSQSSDFFWSGNESLTEDSGLAKVLKNAMASRDFCISSGFVSLKTPEIKDTVKLNLSDTEVDISNSDGYKFKANVNVKYTGIDQSLKVLYENNDYVYFNYLDKKYSLQVNSAYSTILDIYNEFADLGLGTPKIDVQTEKLEDMLKPILSAIGNADETQTSEGWEYAIPMGSLTFGSTTLKDLNLVLKCDKNYYLTYVGLINNGLITINDKLNVGLGINITMGEKGAYVDMTDDEKSAYVGIDTVNKTASSLCSTIADFAKKKNFGAQMNFRLTTDDGSIPEHDITIGMNGDMTGVSSDVTKGKYQVKIDDQGVNNNTNSASVYFVDSTLYMQINQLFKGKVTQASLSDVFSSVSDELSSSTLEGVTTEANSTLTILKNLFSNGYEVPEGIIKDFVIDNTGISFVINASAFALGDYDITAKIETLTDGTFTKISLSNLQYQKLNFDFDLKFADFAGIDAIDTNSYKDYKAIVPLYKSISSIVKAKQFSTSYSMDISTKAGTSYVLSGAIDGDLTGFDTSAATFSEKKFGDYHLSMESVDTALQAANKGGAIHDFDACYQDQSLYFSYDTNFKNYVSNAEIGSIYSLAQEKTGVSSSISFGAMDEVINGIKNSAVLKADLDAIKGGYIRPLESFVSIDKDNLDANKILIVLNIPYIFQDTSLKNKITAATIEVDTDDASITDISVKGFSFDSNSINFDLKLKDFVSFKKPATELTTYTCLDHPIQSFINLPTTLDKFQVGVDASLTKDSKTTTISGFANANTGLKSKEDLSGAGQLTVKESDATQHKIEFGYSTVTLNGEKDGETVAEYNDHMHLVLHNQTVLDIIDQVKHIDETNLLNKYVKELQSATDSLPIMEAIKNQDYSLIVNNLIPEITITDTTLTMKVNPAFFDKSVKTLEGNTNLMTVKFTYDPTTDSITQAYLELPYNGMLIKATLDLRAYDTSVNPTYMAYTDANKSKFIDLDNLKLLVKMGLKTTEVNYFELHGVFNLGAVMSLFSISAMKTYCTAHILVEDGKTHAYLALNNTTSTDITKKGFYCTEYFIDDAGAYVCQTRNDDGGSTKYYSKNFHLTTDEVLKNIFYYVVDFSLNLESAVGGNGLILGTLYDKLNAAGLGSTTSSDVTISKDYSQYVNSAVYTASTKTYALDVALDKIISINLMSFDNALVNVIHDEDNNLTELVVKGGGDDNKIMTALGLIDIEVSLNAWNNIAASENMTRYNEYVAAWLANDQTKNLADYKVTSIEVTKTKLLKIITGRKVNDNGQSVTFYAGSSAPSAFFFIAR